MALTVSQMFLGGISIGIGMLRGTDVYNSFHYETLVGHSNYGASKLAHDHGRSANIVVNNNTIMTAVMGPRMGVDADCTTLDANAAITCPTCPHGSLCGLCKQYLQGRPRALAKQLWARAQQKACWGSLSGMSGQIDQLASMQAGGIVTGDIAKLDSAVKIRFDDPSRMGQIWGGSSTGTSCKLASKDTIPSPVLGHAFPTLVSRNLLEGLPKALVQAMPQMLCGAMSSMSSMGGGGGGGGGGGSPDKIQFPEVKAVADKTRDDCRDYEKQLACAVATARGDSAGCTDEPATEEITYMPEMQARGEVTIPSAAQPYVTCQAATLSSPLRSTGSGGFSYQNTAGQLVTCTFDRDKCSDKKLTENSEDFMKKELGLPKVMSAIGGIAGALGGEARKPSSGGSSPKDFCACSFSGRPVDDKVISITDGVRKIASFGQAQQSEALRKQREYRACGKWYFPDKKGEFASVKQDDQPFVGAWKWALVKQCDGGGS